MFRRIPFLTAMLFTTLLVSPSSGAITYTTLVLSGDTAVGANGNFSGFFSLGTQINDSGKVVFVGYVNPSDELGIWTVDGPTLSNVMLAQTVDPGTGLTFATSFYNAKISNNGDAGASHRVADMSTAYDSLFRGPAGSYSAVALDDDGDNSFAAIDRQIVMFDDGTHAFQATDGDINRGIYFSASGPVAVDETTAPGTSVDFARIFSPLAANEVGGILFKANLVASSADDSGIWSATSAGASLLAREGDPIPEFAPSLYNSFGVGAIADTGEASFLFIARDAQFTGGIMAGTPGSLSVLVQKGDLAPVPGEADAFYTVFRDLQMSGSGNLTFKSDIDGANISYPENEAIFSVIDDVFSQVVRTGDVAPGTGGAVFSGVDEPMINDLEQVIFIADTDDGAFGIWALHGPGLEPVVRIGDLFDLGGGDLREVNGINFSTSSNTQQGALSDGGQVAFQLHFTDASTGIFKADLMPVPEPSVATLLPIGVLAVATFASRPQRSLACS